MQRKLWHLLITLFCVIGLVSLTGCSPDQTQTNIDPANADLVIVSGSENQSLQPLIDTWAKKNNKQIAIVYQGSVDIYRTLQQGRAMPFDAVWPANHLWIELGDSQKVVRHEQSIMRSPVILGLRKSIAERLGWDKRPVKIADILNAAEQQQFRLAMTSATQSNSGASAYLGFLYAMAGYPDTLSVADLQNPNVQNQIKRLFATTNRSSGSSGWLKDSLVQHPDRYDSMFNYEALIIEANQALVKTGQEPLYAIYPEDGLTIADSPLGLVEKGDKAKETLFLELQAYLLSAPIQQQIETMGRRTGLIGTTVSKANPAVWNPAWGLKTDAHIASVPIPQQNVLQLALNLYQTELRKPSFTVWVLDVSGSMAGAGITDLKQAMTTLLDPEQAKGHLLQPGERDVTIVIPFNDQVLGVWQANGNESEPLQNLLTQVRSLPAEGGTDLYAGLIAALRAIQASSQQTHLEDYLTAIVAMTDGRSEEGRANELYQLLQTQDFARNIPIHSIAFGDADARQLENLAQMTAGRFFTVKTDLPSVLREAKGYN